MRLNTDSKIEVLTQDILKLFSASHHQVPPHYSIHQLRTELATIQRTRAFRIWHDHSTILKTSYTLFAVWVIYDPAVFLTAEECKSISNLQELLEEPTIYMILPSGSSPSNQLALVGDRVECLQEMSSNIVASNGVVVHDKMRFFCGDKPARQFNVKNRLLEPTSVVGVAVEIVIMMQDIAHALHCKWRSLKDLQTLVLGGTDGKQPCMRFETIG